MTTTENHPPKLLFWGLLIVAQIGAFLLFKDLADLSQWVIQSEREFTMFVWYNRWIITAITAIAVVGYLLLWFRNRLLLNGKLLALLTFLCLFNVYAGMFNTHLMFRAQGEPGSASFVPVSEAAGHLEKMFHASYEKPQFENVDEISVLVLETDQGARAYTDYYMLQPHVIEGGSVGGEEVIMTYCGLTNMGIAYSPVINGQKLELRAVNQLRNNLLMADANTGEPVQQFWGTLERDGEHGPAMKQWPTVRMPFGTFRKLYPNGEVYVNNIEQSDNAIVRFFDRAIRDGIMVHAVRTLQWQTDKPAFPTIKEFDDRLPPKKLVYGINIGDDYVAYTKEFVAQHGGLLNVSIGGQPVVVYYDQQLDSLTAFYNPTGQAINQVDLFGQSDQGQLNRVETLKSGIFWFIWYDFYKQTDVNRLS